MNKRGSLVDTIYGPIFILVISMTIVICFYIWNQISDEFLSMPTNTATINNSLNSVINNADVALSAFDYMIPFLVGGLLIVSLVFAFKRGAGVLYIGLSLIMWILALLMAAVFTNIFEQFSASFTTTIANFPILNWTMLNIKWVVLGWLFLISIVMFTRNKKEEEVMTADQVFTQ